MASRKQPHTRRSARASAVGRTGAAAVLADGTGYMLRRASLAVYGAFMAEVGTLGLKPAEYAALVVIDSNPGARSADVSALLAIEKANFTGFLRRLERRGWVRREPSSTDGRAHALHLTLAGNQLLQAAAQRRQSMEAGLAARLGVLDHARLVGLLQSVLEPAPPATPPAGKTFRTASTPGPDRAG